MALKVLLAHIFIIFHFSLCFSTSSSFRWVWKKSNDRQKHPSFSGSYGDYFSSKFYPSSRKQFVLTGPFDDFLFLFGGTESFTDPSKFSASYYGDIWQYSIKQGLWRYLNTNPLDPNLQKNCSNFHGEYNSHFEDISYPGSRTDVMYYNSFHDKNVFYIFGGFGFASNLDELNGWLSCTWAFDTKKLKWRWMATFGEHSKRTDSWGSNDYPASRSSGHIFDMGDGTFYLFGGFIINSLVVDDFWILNEEKSEWKMLNHYVYDKWTINYGQEKGKYAGDVWPGQRAWGITWVYKGGLYIFGGLCPNNNNNNPMSEIGSLFQYNTTINLWRYVTTIGITLMNYSPQYGTEFSKEFHPGARSEMSGFLFEVNMPNRPDGNFSSFFIVGGRERFYGGYGDVWEINLQTELVRWVPTSNYPEDEKKIDFGPGQYEIVSEEYNKLYPGTRFAMNQNVPLVYTQNKDAGSVTAYFFGGGAGFNHPSDLWGFQIDFKVPYVPPIIPPHIIPYIIAFVIIIFIILCVALCVIIFVIACIYWKRDQNKRYPYLRIEETKSIVNEKSGSINAEYTQRDMVKENLEDEEESYQTIVVRDNETVVEGFKSKYDKKEKNDEVMYVDSVVEREKERIKMEIMKNDEQKRMKLEERIESLGKKSHEISGFIMITKHSAIRENCKFLNNFLDEEGSSILATYSSEKDFQKNKYKGLSEMIIVKNLFDSVLDKRFLNYPYKILILDTLARYLMFYLLKITSFVYLNDKEKRKIEMFSEEKDEVKSILKRFRSIYLGKRKEKEDRDLFDMFKILEEALIRIKSDRKIKVTPLMKLGVLLSLNIASKGFKDIFDNIVNIFDIVKKEIEHSKGGSEWFTILLEFRRIYHALVCLKGSGQREKKIIDSFFSRVFEGNMKDLFIFNPKNSPSFVFGVYNVLGDLALNSKSKYLVAKAKNSINGDVGLRMEKILNKKKNSLKYRLLIKLKLGFNKIE